MEDQQHQQHQVKGLYNQVRRHQHEMGGLMQGGSGAEKAGVSSRTPSKFSTASKNSNHVGGVLGVASASQHQQSSTSH